MRANRIKTLWEDGDAAINGWLAIPNAFSAETMAHAGWDALTIDMQHGVVDYGAAVSMLTAISTTSVTPLVRVPWLDPGIVMKMLDAGAYALICPMGSTREDAFAIKSRCGWVAAAVADGLGSHAHSRFGASFAVVPCVAMNFASVSAPSRPCKTMSSRHFLLGSLP